jgi:photosystem I subunit 9
MAKQNDLLTWLSLAPIQLFLLLSAQAVLLIVINMLYPDLLSLG